MRTDRILFAGGFAAATAATGCHRAPKTADRPLNIVYIMTDDHTAQMMSCYDRATPRRPTSTAWPRRAYVSPTASWPTR